MLLSASFGTMLKHYSQEESIKLMHEAGFDAIDFSFPSNESFYSTDSNPDDFTKLRKLVEESGMTFNQAHAPYRNPKGTDEIDQYVSDIVQSIKNSSLLGIKTIVVHPLKYLEDVQESASETLFEANMRFYNRFKPYCEAYNVKVALENMWMWKSYTGGRAIVHCTCSKPDEFVRYLDELNSECFVGCFDIGHAALVHEDPANFIKKVGNKYLKALHIHDVNGYRDVHTIPYYGGMVDWDSVAKALKDINYDGDFTFEAGRFLEPLPKELFPVGVKMMAEVGKHIMSKITE